MKTKDFVNVHSETNWPTFFFAQYGCSFTCNNTNIITSTLIFMYCKSKVYNYLFPVLQIYIILHSSVTSPTTVLYIYVYTVACLFYRLSHRWYIQFNTSSERLGRMIILGRIQLAGSRGESDCIKTKCYFTRSRNRV